MQFSLARRAIIAHRDVALARLHAPDGRCIGLFSVAVARFSLLIVRDLSLVLNLVMNAFVYLAQTLIERVFAVASDVLVDLCFVDVR